MTYAQETKKNADTEEMRSDAVDDQIRVEEWLAIRKEAGLKIVPETAEVFWKHGYVLDPYGVDRNMPEECRQIGRLYFASSQGSDIWVSYYDLPDETRKALWVKIDAGYYDDDLLDRLFND